MVVWYDKYRNTGSAIENENILKTAKTNHLMNCHFHGNSKYTQDKQSNTKIWQDSGSDLV